MTGITAQLPIAKFFDANGHPASGHKVYTYLAGSTSPETTWQDNSLSVSNTNPITLDSRGEALIWLDPSKSYKFVLKTQAGAVVQTQDNISNPYGGLSDDTGSSLVGFIQSGAGSAKRTVQEKLRDLVSVKDFGAVGNGVADDTTAFAAACAYCVTYGKKLLIDGAIRITSGYAFSTNYRTLELVGQTWERENNSGAVQSQIILDSNSASAYFVNMTGRGTLNVRALSFKCAQTVSGGERSAIIFNSNCLFSFENVDFENVDTVAIYFGASCYFQSGVLRDVQFRGTGNMFAAHSNALKGTMLTLDNVHTSSAPATAASKVFCDLSGVRQIRARNTILEGGMTATGWTVLKLDNSAYDAPYTRAPFAEFQGFHSEWSGSAVSYVVDQVAGTAVFDDIVGISNTALYRLTNSARAIIRNTAFISSSSYSPDACFSLADQNCQVILENCPARAVKFNVPGIVQINTTFVQSGVNPYSMSDNAPAVLLKWNGGIWEAEGGTTSLGGGTTLLNSTDASYGRKLLIVPSASAIDAQLRVPTVSRLQTGDTVSIRALVKFPTYASGAMRLALLRDGVVETGGDTYWNTSYSGSTAEILITAKMTSSPASRVGLFVSNYTASVTGNFEIISIGIYAGSSVPMAQSPVYPANVVTYGSAAPTTGTWARGDVVKNNSPAVGSAKGWVCTLAGTPGTWVSEGNL